MSASQLITGGIGPGARVAFLLTLGLGSFGGQTVSGDVSEAVAAAMAPSAGIAVAVDAADTTASATSTTSASLIAFATRGEAATAAESSTAGGTFGASVVEAASASDQEFPAGVILVAIAESASASDQETARVDWIVSASDAAAAGDISSGSGVYGELAVESAEATAGFAFEAVTASTVEIMVADDLTDATVGRFAIVEEAAVARDVSLLTHSAIEVVTIRGRRDYIITMKGRL